METRSDNQNPGAAAVSSSEPAKGSASRHEEKKSRSSGGKAMPRRFDFQHPTMLSSGEWRALRVKIGDFVESVAAVLSTYLRVDFSLQLGRLETMGFTEFTAALPATTHITLFKLEPLRGISLLDIRPSIGFGIIDRLLGGGGQPLASERNLTEMEVALMDQFVQMFLDEWCKQWLKHHELQAEILGHENNPKFLQSSSGETVLIAATLEARLKETVGQMQLAFPCRTLEPIIKKLGLNTSAPAANPPPPTPAPTPAPKWNASLNDVPLTFSARWPAFKGTARELLELKPGKIIELSSEGAETIELCIGKQVKFKGRLGVRENKRAIQITEVCKL